MHPINLVRSLRLTLLGLGFLVFSVSTVRLMQHLAHAQPVMGQRSIALFSGHSTLTSGYNFSLFSNDAAKADTTLRPAASASTQPGHVASGENYDTSPKQRGTIAPRVDNSRSATDDPGLRKVTSSSVKPEKTSEQAAKSLAISNSVQANLPLPE